MMSTFLRVADLSSFSRAAEDLGLPKASVSTAIQDLETLLGSRLLNRTTRKVQLTPDGINFYERCKDLLADVEELQSMFREGTTGITGRIRFDMPSRLARDLFIPRLPEFLDKYPGIHLEVSSTDRRVDVIREGFDCVVRIGKLLDSTLTARNLGTISLVNCVSPRYIKKHGKPKSLADLAQHDVVHYTNTLGTKPDGFEYFDGKSYVCIPTRSSVTVNNADAYLATCLAGLGLIQVPHHGVTAHLKDGSLVEVLPKFNAEPMPVSLVYPHRRHLARRVQLFMDWAAETIKDYLD